MSKKAIIIGAGPAGLTAAYELLKRTDIIPVILEKSGEIGGISRTINYKGNRMDMGPHRFFSKSDRVMDWWLNIMPLEGEKTNITIAYQNKQRSIETNPGATAIGKRKDSDKVMLVIQRLTRIYFLRRFFAYPIQLSLETLRTLGVLRTWKILLSFLWIRLFPIKNEKNLEDFLINKFGRQLYLLFFKDYTEKVWGVPCHSISSEWGAQRIKGVSLSKAIFQALRSFRKGEKKDAGINQKATETSLIEQFLYPKKGPGALWEEVARQVQEMGGKIFLNQQVEKIYHKDGEITMINTVSSVTGQAGAWEGDYFFSTMPVQELIAGMDSPAPTDVQAIAAGLQYRDFINVGILLEKLSARNKDGIYKKLQLKDNWIYIQERDVKVGRLMIYNNWGDGMIADPSKTWIGMEYFCDKTDSFWALDDEAIQRIAILELEKMALARAEDVLDITVRRMEKTYPAYFGTFSEFGKIREYTDQFCNLFLVGRNGMHKYNNADHSMLTAMVAVDNIVAGNISKDNLWSINTEQDYHEEKKSIPEEIILNEPTLSRKDPLPEYSFKSFLWKNKWNRAYLLLAAVAMLAQFAIFKFLYPYANYFVDSYSYLEAAYRNSDVNTWPVAYSKFLRIFSAFSHSDMLLVAFQYFFIQCSSLFLLFTVQYFFKPSKIIFLILYVFFLFNPISHYLANYISADATFIGLSTLWIAQLIWIICRPMTSHIFIHAVLLLLVFTLRYNAIYYPLISTLAFIFTKRHSWFKIAGIAFSFMLLSFSVLYTSQKMYKVTGYRQFSAFGGWQLANNALYAYEHVKNEPNDKFPERFAKLENMVRQHKDTILRVKQSRLDTLRNYFYLWSPRAPLLQYMMREWKGDSTSPYFKKWAAEGPLYQDYAFFLIKKYPLSFAQYFLWPNAIKFAVPPIEFLGVYNMGEDSVDRLAKEWFDYKTLRISHHYKDHDVTSLNWYPIFNALVNLFLVISLAGFLLFNGIKIALPSYTIVLALILVFWILNMGFSIFASPVVLRYQVFPASLSFVFALLSTRYIDLRN
ncbi:NAD(P)/FAD-dependent oxidoreductase [Flavitalea sp. BT771]|uniref:NAD(P)/FAD-dependent oxidoreductase n=1 Tax=Flavitalea sp. BT771 TaxID=3063329 RepID=UPI0026E2E216|nr:NAD(P)/FAD-dependent oxidoreductase [Flavitalea sp. BT771]MDO6433886.1 NAD(P)/FAD-dependent oxidoreductase [Flavitalea sp. BT771]MDV6222209.1 NAD(P)/FAD-dependent oxidoreductase [Flavitalea sp. BT771]